MKTGLLLTSFLFFKFIAIGQILPFNWSIGISGQNHVDIGNLIVDEYGNIYSIGTFHGSVDFDPSANSLMRNSNGNGDAYLSKFDKHGDLIWVKAMGGNGYDFGIDLSFDKDGNIIFVLNISKGTVTIDSQNLIQAEGSRDILFAKLNTDGNILWLKHIKGSTNLPRSAARAFDLSLDAEDNIYLCGGIADSTDFDPSQSTAKIAGINGDLGRESVFIAKYNSHGIYQWVRHYGSGIDSEVGRNIMTDSKGVWVSTHLNSYAGLIDLDPGNQSDLLRVSGSAAVFSHYDTLGNYNKSWVFEGPQSSSVGGYIDLALIDKNDNLYISGSFKGEIDFDPRNSHQLNFNATNTTGLIAKYSPSGQNIWIHQLSKNSGVNNVIQDAKQNLYFSIAFKDSIDIDPSSNHVPFYSNADYDALFVKFDSTGIYQNAESFGGPSRDILYKSIIDIAGNFYMIGGFEDSCDFDVSTNTSTLLSAGGQDVFIRKIGHFTIGLSDIKRQKEQIIISPNPSNNGTISIKSSFNYNRILFYNLEGKLIKQLKQNESLIDVSDLKKGMYVVQFISGNNSAQKRLLIN